MNDTSFNSFVKRLKLFQKFPSVYDAISGFSEFGPIGATMKANLVNTMRNVFRQEDFWEVDCPVISPTIVWKASGHLDRFSDIIAESDGKIYRIEKVLEEQFPDKPLTERTLSALTRLIQESNVIPKGNREPLHNAREYSLMIQTSVADTPAVLRPETATTTYLSFKDYLEVMRGLLPLKLFQYGRAFRNEITSKQGLIRGREFEQFEGQIFISEEQKKDLPEFEFVKSTKLQFWDRNQQKDDREPQIKSLEMAVEDGTLGSPAYAYCFGVLSRVLDSVGINPLTAKLRQHLLDEMAHYALDAWDVEVPTENFGLVEVCGIHDRSDYDLKRHQQFSGKDYSVRSPSGKQFIPHILEIAFGIGRTLYCTLEHNFTNRDGKNVLTIPAKISPYHAAVFPLLNKKGMPEFAREIYRSLKEMGLMVAYEQKGSIGKRYARYDEIGVPWCITIDHQSIEDCTVTVRNRNDSTQRRVKKIELYNAVINDQ